MHPKPALVVPVLVTDCQTPPIDYPDTWTPNWETQEDKCRRHAGFLSHLDRPHFDALYWSMFFAVIIIFFISTSIYSWAVRYREENEGRPDFNEHVFKKRLETALICNGILSTICTVLAIIEVFTLMCLQFCDGEDLMPLFWATWMMLQGGATVANIGVLLALIHVRCNIRQPLWALALGTPVLVVAGIGHLVTWLFEVFFKKANQEVREGGFQTSMSSSWS